MWAAALQLHAVSHVKLGSTNAPTQLSNFSSVICGAVTTDVIALLPSSLLVKFPNTSECGGCGVTLINRPKVSAGRLKSCRAKVGAPANRHTVARPRRFSSADCILAASGSKCHQVVPSCQYHRDHSESSKRSPRSKTAVRFQVEPSYYCFERMRTTG